MTNEVKHATVDAVTASNLLDVMFATGKNISDAEIQFYIAVFKFYDTGAWHVVDKYQGRANGFVQAVSDAKNLPQGTVETEEQYTERWKGFSSTAYNYKNAGKLAMKLANNDFGTDWPKVRAYHLVTCAQLLTSPNMKGDEQLALDTISNLLDRVGSGELVDQSKLRAEVKRLMGEGQMAKGKTKKMVLSFDVEGLSDEEIKTIKSILETQGKGFIAMQLAKK